VEPEIVRKYVSSCIENKPWHDWTWSNLFDEYINIVVKIIWIQN